MKATPGSGMLAAILVATTLLASAGWALSAPNDAGAGACPAPGASVAEPYRWYPSLDLARIPFHAAEGPWGPRAPIAAPAPPVTRRTVRVTSAAQFATEALVPGTRVIIDADYIGPTVLFGDVTDLDIVVPPGRTVARLWIGRYNPPSTTRRVRVRGTTPGQHSGGLIGNLVFYSGPATDLIIDGVDLNGDDGQGGGLLLHLARSSERVAVVNIRGHGVGAAFLGVSDDIVFAGNRILSAARPGEVNGWPEGWGLRVGGDRIVVYDNRIDGTRYHRVRVHPEPGQQQYAWVANNTFVDPREARIFAAIDMSGRKPVSHSTAVWALCNLAYAHSSCIPGSFEAPHANYARVTSNTYFGSITEADLRHRQAWHGPGRDYLSGNRFAAWRSPPAWETPGDPATVPLPPVKADRYTARFASTLKCSPP